MSAQLDWTEAELLATAELAEPLFAGGRRCHGGFDASGTYISPRTAGRVPAIGNWQAKHRAVFGTDIIDAPLADWPGSYPNVAQGRLLLRHGVTAPIASILTRIGTVEGFGGLIRVVGCGEVQPHLHEPITGTALAHLERGLFEAHARDETGHGNELGHKEMWFAARDIAFDRPYSEDETAEVMARMGIPAGAAAAPSRGQVGSAAPPPVEPLFARVDQGFESMLRFMVGLMFIEVSAFHTFAWAEALLDDPELCAGDGEAANIIRYISADETPHVEYLRTAITEVRDRTVIDRDGQHIPGATFVARIWERGMAESLGPRRALFIEATNREIARALEQVAGGADILQEFHALSDIAPSAPSTPSVEAHQ